MQLGAHGLGDGAGLLGVPGIEQMMAGLKQVVNVGPPALGPGDGPPLPVLGGALVSACQLGTSARGGQHSVQLTGHPGLDEHGVPVSRRSSAGSASSASRASGARGASGARRASRARGDDEHPGCLAGGEHLAEVGWRLVCRRRPSPVGCPRRGPVGPPYLEQDSIAIGRLAVDRDADEQALGVSAQLPGEAVERYAPWSAAAGLPVRGRRPGNLTGHARPAGNGRQPARALIAFSGTLLPPGIPGSSDNERYMVRPNPLCEPFVSSNLSTANLMMQ